MKFTKEMFTNTNYFTDLLHENEEGLNETVDMINKEFTLFFETETNVDILDFLRFFYDIFEENTGWVDSVIFEIESVILRNYRRA